MMAKKHLGGPLQNCAVILTYGGGAVHAVSYIISPTGPDRAGVPVPKHLAARCGYAL